MPTALAQAGLLLLTLLLYRWMPSPLFMLLGFLPLLAYAIAANRSKRHSVRGSTVLITGASSGLGRAMALDAARRGASKVLLVSRTESALQTVAEDIEGIAPTCEAVVLPCDVTDTAAVQELAQTVVVDHGPPDILVNNAGSGAWKHLEDTSHDEIDAFMALPTMAAMHLTRALVPAMAARGSGHVVNVTSAASMGAIRGAVVYATARWGMRALSIQLRADLAELGLGVTLVNAAEIGDTAYFHDAPGKAGAASHDHIPWLFQQPIVQKLSFDSGQTAKASWDAVERGEAEAFVPLHLLAPVDLINRLMPEALYQVLRLGPNGLRRT